MSERVGSEIRRSCSIENKRIVTSRITTSKCGKISSWTSKISFIIRVLFSLKLSVRYGVKNIVSWHNEIFRTEGRTQIRWKLNNSFEEFNGCDDATLFCMRLFKSYGFDHIKDRTLRYATCCQLRRGWLNFATILTRNEWAFTTTLIICLYNLAPKLRENNSLFFIFLNVTSCRKLLFAIF